MAHNTQSTAYAEFEHNAKLWFEDGNIILIAEQVGFKVHRGVLGLHSTVFADMFSLPQPQTSSETLDGCPVVNIADESARDIEFVLKIMYDGRGFHDPRLVATFRDVSTALRLGSKFQFESMRKEAVARLSICFPSTLHKFHSGVSLFRTHDVANPGVRPIQMRQSDAVAVFHLARTFGLEELVPAAIYTCAQLTVNQLFAEHRNGSFTLSELEECIKERENMHTECIASYRLIQKGETDPRCKLVYSNGTSKCTKALKHLSGQFIKDRALWKATDQPDPLLSLDRQIDDFPTTPGDATVLCKLCCMITKTRQKEHRQAVWNRLWKRYGPTPAAQ